jgi:hypothetical protein
MLDNTRIAWIWMRFVNKQTTMLIHKVSFPGAVYRNKTQLHGNIYRNRYSKCSPLFQYIRHRNWDICHTVGPTSVYSVVEVCRLGLEPLCSGVSCSGTHRVHNFLNNRCSVPISCNKEREICRKWLLSSLIVKLCSVHSETLSLIALHSRRELEKELPSSTAATLLLWERRKYR